MKWQKILTIVLFVSVILVGCNTIEGVGRDLESAGGAIREGATDVKDGMQ